MRTAFRVARGIAGTLALLVVLRITPAGAAPATPVRVVSAEDVVLASMLLAGEGTARPVLLFDPRHREALASYLSGRKRPVDCMRRRVTPAPVVALMEAAAGTTCALADDPIALAHTLWPAARTAVVTATGDYEWLLRAAAFAGATGSALLPLDDGAVLTKDTFKDWPIETLYLTPPVLARKADAAGLVARVVEVTDPDALTAELVRSRGADPPRAIVVANPRDRFGIFSPSSLSLLAPLLSATHRAPLFLVSRADAAAVEQEVTAWIDRHGLHPSHVILVGDELALRSHRVPDPVLAAGGPEALGGGTEVRVELFSGIQQEQPQDYAVGRIVAEDAAQASATLARQLHRRKKDAKKPAIFLSNADAVFALGETISRTTVNELRNAGIPVRAYFRDEITPAVIQKALADTELLVWEGHARDLTLEERGGIPADAAPAFVVLQGCYTLDRSDPFILMERGTQAIVATSAAIYSASGAAFAHALFDALLYDGADLGTAVRDARNYLLALAQLKRARQHRDWRKTYRAALAFALWGDPTARPRLRPTRPIASPVRWAPGDGQLSLVIPTQRLAAVRAGRYYAQPVSRAMLGGLMLRDGASEERRLKEMYFTVQHRSDGATRACSPNPGWDVVSLYAPRTETLSVLARPDWDKLPGSNEHGSFAFPLALHGASCPAGSGTASDMAR